MNVHKNLATFIQNKFTIYIDINDSFTDSSSFYFHPNRLDSLSRICHDVIDSFIIKNCKTDKLNHTTFLNIYKALKPHANCEITVFPYDTIELMESNIYQIEASARSVGFTNFTKNFETYCLTCIKSDKSNKNTKTNKDHHQRELKDYHHNIIQNYNFIEENKDLNFKKVNDIRIELLKHDLNSAKQSKKVKRSSSTNHSQEEKYKINNKEGANVYVKLSSMN